MSRFWKWLVTPSLSPMIVIIGIAVGNTLAWLAGWS